MLNGWGVKPIPFTDGMSDSALLYALRKPPGTQSSGEDLYLGRPPIPRLDAVDLAMTRRVVDQWAAASGQKPIIVCDNTMLGPVFPATDRTWNRHLRLFADQYVGDTAT